MAGSVFVTHKFKKTIIGEPENPTATCRLMSWSITETLAGSKFEDESYAKALSEKFDTLEKCRFRDVAEDLCMKIGAKADNDDDRGIRGGQIRFQGYVSSAFFFVVTTIDHAHTAVWSRRRSRTLAPAPSMLSRCTFRIVIPCACLPCRQPWPTNFVPNQYVFLVGGFAASPFLFQEVKTRLSTVVKDIKRADSQTCVILHLFTRQQSSDPFLHKAPRLSLTAP